MVNDTQINSSNLIIREEFGERTGEMLYQTANGRWWKPYEGEIIKTGQEIKELYR